ncbi:hypothetical protein [Cohnella rhizosphaerae]|uniref:Uncharacterized protein n=1 Tax=Cohnella rhizosphaerae TaxID=1457232 RepID=A0A9X4KSR8_9BACL|nr:hypothetical protein [Cohnella rhizosphaerae]MDG0808059.1 hypothetical protein [Cohnella rhizosphaerae]
MNKQINETILPKIDSLLGISNEDVENNYGLVSQGPENGYSRWNLHYPSRTNTEIQITIMGDGHNPLEGDYIAGLQLYTISTARGVKVGDSSEDLINVYGKPSEKTDNKLTYLKGTKKLIFELDNKTISGITIDYEFERAEKDQGFK